MAKLSKEELARYEGAAWALRLVDSKGFEEAKKELIDRGAYNMPLQVSKADLHNFSEECKTNVLDTVLLLSLYTLRDEFGFGSERANRFKKRFNEKAECLLGEYCVWQDVQDIVKDELGIDVLVCKEVKDSQHVNSLGIPKNKIKD